MATATYTPIASITLGSSASSVTFSSIPQDYRDLIITVEGSISSGAQEGRFEFNGDTTEANTTSVFMNGDGSSATSFTSNHFTFFYTDKSFYIVQVMDYSATDKHKSILSRGSRETSFTRAGAARWANTSAVTSILMRPNNVSVDWASGTKFALWGIAS